MWKQTASLDSALIEHRSELAFPLCLWKDWIRWRSGAFLTVCQDAQCNHLIFLVHPHFAGVIFGCWVSLSASTKCIWDCTAQLNRLTNPCQRIVSICILSTAQGFRWTRWRDNVLKWSCTPCGQWHWLVAGKQRNCLILQTNIVVRLPFYNSQLYELMQCTVTFKSCLSG